MPTSRVDTCIINNSWDAPLCSCFGTMCGNITVKKLIDIKFGFWVYVRKYNGTKLIEIKLGFRDNVRKYNVKKLIKIKLGFWGNIQKYNGKKLLEIKLGILEK